MQQHQHTLRCRLQPPHPSLSPLLSLGRCGERFQLRPQLPHVLLFLPPAPPQLQVEVLDSRLRDVPHEVVAQARLTRERREGEQVAQGGGGQVGGGAALAGVVVEEEGGGGDGVEVRGVEVVEGELVEEEGGVGEGALGAEGGAEAVGDEEEGGEGEGEAEQRAEVGDVAQPEGIDARGGGR